ncbi:MAG: RICIN domain-containing protein [Eggerthellaceae bacterium]|nr:RICIN domain-containing protein [Eggerthellaceae bacterium]
MKKLFWVLVVALLYALALPQLALAAPASTTKTAAPALTSTAASANSTDAELSNGVYVINSALSASIALDIEGGSTANDAKAQIWEANMSAAQRWYIEKISNTKYYKITNVGSGKVLDVTGGSKKSGTRIQQHNWNNTPAQMWKISKTKNGVTISSALSDKLVLDVALGSKKNGTAVRIYNANNSTAQTWKINKVNRTLENGFYVFVNTGSKKALEVASGAFNNGANIAQHTVNSSMAQTFQVIFNTKTGYYTLRSAVSGKVLDVEGASNNNGANVWQYESNKTKAQMWAIVKNKDGSYTLRSALNGLALDVVGASKANGANVQTYISNGTAAQKWTAKTVSNWLPSGCYYFMSAANKNNVMSVANTSVANSANIRTASNSGSNATRFFLRATTNGYYTIQNTYSGKYVDAVNVVKYGNIAQSSSQEQWKPVLSDNGIVFKLKANPDYVLDISGGSTSAGANIQLYPSNNTVAQKWLVKPASMLEDGYYTIASASNNSFVFDNPSSSKSNGTKIQVWKANKTPAQSFFFKHKGGNQYQVTNAASNKALQNSGSFVVQQTPSSATSQLWRPVVNVNGTMSFTSMSDKSKRIALNGAAAKGTKLSVVPSANNAKQNWIVRDAPGGITTYCNLSITLNQMTSIEGGSAANLSTAGINKYHFLDLRHYSGSTAEQLDAALESIAPWIGPGNPLYKSGKYFVEAAKKYNLNEVFLIAHACGETGWGSAGGYNFYGVNGGGGYGGWNAAVNGWTSVESGIVGGAKYLADEWIYRPNYPQHSPYGLRFDYHYTDKTRSYSWHHFTTEDYWLDTLSNTIDKFYQRTGTGKNANFVIPKYK